MRSLGAALCLIVQFLHKKLEEFLSSLELGVYRVWDAGGVYGWGVSCTLCTLKNLMCRYGAVGWQ